MAFFIEIINVSRIKLIILLREFKSVGFIKLNFEIIN